MASIRIIHYTHKVYKDGTSPIILQIISGKVVKKKTLAAVLPDQWDDKTQRVKPKKHPNYGSINSKISKEYNKYEAVIIDADKSGSRLDISRIFDSWVADKDFAQVAELYLSSCTPFTRKTNTSHIKVFKEYIARDIHLADITKNLIDDYTAHLRASGNAESTIATKISTLRSVSSYAKAKLKYPPAPGLVDITLPSRKGKSKVKLKPEEIEKLANAELKSGSIMAQSRDAFLLAFYCGGMRVADIIQAKKEHFKEGRYKYIAQKNGKIFNYPLQPRALEIINRNSHGEYVFSFFKFKPDPFKSDIENEKAFVKHINSKTTQINNNLKRLAGKLEMSKHITSHVSRHSFADKADKKLGGDLRKLQALLGHGSRKTTEGYIQDIRQSDELDKDMGSVFED